MAVEITGIKKKSVLEMSSLNECKAFKEHYF